MTTATDPLLAELGALLAIGYRRLQESEVRLDDGGTDEHSCANPGHQRESRLGRGRETDA